MYKKNLPRLNLESQRRARYNRERNLRDESDFTAASSTGAHPTVTLSSINATGTIQESPKGKGRFTELNAYLVGDDWKALKEPTLSSPAPPPAPQPGPSIEDLIQSTPPRTKAYKNPSVGDDAEEDAGEEPTSNMVSGKNLTTLLDNLVTAQDDSLNEHSDKSTSVVTEQHDSEQHKTESNDTPQSPITLSVTAELDIPAFALPNTNNITGSAFTVPQQSHIADFVSGSLKLSKWTDKNKIPIFVRHGQAKDKETLGAQNEYADFESLALPKVEEKIFVSLDKVREEVRALQEHDELVSRQAEHLANEVQKLDSEVSELERLKNENTSLHARLKQAEFGNKKKEIEIQSLKNKHSDALFVNYEQDMLIIHQKEKILTLESAVKQTSEHDALQAQLDEANKNLALANVEIANGKKKFDVSQKQHIATIEKLNKVRLELDMAKQDLPYAGKEFDRANEHFISTDIRQGAHGNVHGNVHAASGEPARHTSQSNEGSPSKGMDKTPDMRPPRMAKRVEHPWNAGRNVTESSEGSIIKSMDKAPEMSSPRMAKPRGQRETAGQARHSLKTTKSTTRSSGITKPTGQQYAHEDGTLRPSQDPAIALSKVMNSLRQEEKDLQYATAKKQAIYDQCDPRVHRSMQKKLYSEMEELRRRRGLKRMQIYDLYDLVVAHKEGTAKFMTLNDIDDTVMSILSKDPDWDGTKHLDA
ncbi:hypothetical protein F5Y16DRAFT_382836 [Xylariaceae sp. FL0255]|nr:hypothetical protein F5Y16DRAFT_382836 [Xylariaceae sp. FL0255]